MKRIAKTSAGILAGLSLVVPGVVSANMADIGTTGPDSTNKVEFKNSQKAEVENNNNLSLANSTSQNADSGNAKVWGNTTGGDATSGDSTNEASLSVDASVDNSSAADIVGALGSGSGSDEATIENTGPDSYNKVTFNDRTHVEVTNNNNISLSNSVSQTATTGDASVKHNTTGGDATTGSASNSSTSEFTLSITN